MVSDYYSMEVPKGLDTLHSRGMSKYDRFHRHPHLEPAATHCWRHDETVGELTIGDSRRDSKPQLRKLQTATYRDAQRA